MKRILFFAFLCLCVCLSAGAQALSPVTWTAYGLTFKVPKGIVVEEDTEETFLLNDSKFYITVQALDSDGITKGDLEGMSWLPNEPTDARSLTFSNILRAESKNFSSDNLQPIEADGKNPQRSSSPYFEEPS